MIKKVVIRDAATNRYYAYGRDGAYWTNIEDAQLFETEAGAIYSMECNLHNENTKYLFLESILIAKRRSI